MFVLLVISCSGGSGACRLCIYLVEKFETLANEKSDCLSRKKSDQLFHSLLPILCCQVIDNLLLYMPAFMLGDKDLERIKAKSFTLVNRLEGELDKTINDCTKNKTYLHHRVISRGTQRMSWAEETSTSVP